MNISVNTLPPASEPSSPSSGDDLVAGGTLLAISGAGILLHLIEMVAMSKLVRKVIGFRFFLVLSFSDIWLLLIFGAFPGWIILSKEPGLLTVWARQLHVWADTCWFSMCYMNVVIAVTRFWCVVFPLQFRRLRKQSTCWLICGSVWLLSLAQSCAMNNLPWFVVLWYSADAYGMACDWEAYATSGTRNLYLGLNLMVIAAYLLIYLSTASTIFFKRNIRFRFLATVCADARPSNSGDSQQQPGPNPAAAFVVDADGGRVGSKCGSNAVFCNQQQQQQQQQMANTTNANDNQPNKVNNKNNQQQQLQQHQQQQQVLLMRTISVLKGTAGGARTLVRGSNNSYSSNEPFGSSLSLEVRLVIPCCVNSLIFIVAQLIIIRGGVGVGHWAGFSVMFIFCVQSIAPPILRFTFSQVLREQALLTFGIGRRAVKRRFRLWTVVASMVSRHR